MEHERTRRTGSASAEIARQVAVLPGPGARRSRTATVLSVRTHDVSRVDPASCRSCRRDRRSTPTGSFDAELHHVLRAALEDRVVPRSRPDRHRVCGSGRGGPRPRAAAERKPAANHRPCRHCFLRVALTRATRGAAARARRNRARGRGAGATGRRSQPERGVRSWAPARAAPGPARPREPGTGASV